MAKKPTFSAADLSVARVTLQRLERERRGLDALGELVFLIENHDQVLSERKRALDAINAEIEKREAATFEAAETAGKREAKKVVAEARKQAESIMSNMNRRRDEINEAVEAKEAELDALQERIDRAKNTVRAVLSAA